MNRRWVWVGVALLSWAGRAAAGDRCLERMGRWGYGPTTVVAASDEMAVVGAGERLLAVKAPIGAAPEILGEALVASPVEDLAVQGTTALVGMGFGGVCIVDFSDPERPRVSATWSMSGDIAAVALSGTTAYALDVERAEVWALDWAAAPGPRPLGVAAVGVFEWYRDDVNGTFALAVEGATVFVSNNEQDFWGDCQFGRITMIDFGDPSRPAAVDRDTWESCAGLGRDIILVDDAVWVVGRAGTIAFERSVDGLDFVREAPDMTGLRADVRGSNVVLTSWGGIDESEVWSFEDPFAPVRRDGFGGGSSPADGAWVRESILTASRSGVIANYDAVDVDQVDAVGTVAVDAFDVRLAALDGVIGLTWSTDGLLRSWAVSNHGDLKHEGSVAVPDSTENQPVGVVVAQDTAVICGSSITVVNVSDPATPRVVGSLPLAVNHCVGGDEGRLIAADLEHIWVVDVSDPVRPVVAEPIASDDRVSGLAFDEGIIYVSLFHGILETYEMGSSDGLVPLGRWDPDGVKWIDHLTVSSGVAVAQLRRSPGEMSIAVVDIEDPQLPEILGEFDLPAATSAGSIVVQDGLAYVTLREVNRQYQHIVVLDFRRPNHPRPLFRGARMREGGGIVGSPDGTAILQYRHRHGIAVYDTSRCPEQLVPWGTTDRDPGSR